MTLNHPVDPTLRDREPLMHATNSTATLPQPAASATLRAQGGCDQRDQHHDHPEKPQSVVARVLLWLIGAYRVLRGGTRPACRYWPTCSAYGAEAVARFGALRGGYLTFRRLSRCHPFGDHGVDPVPDTFALRRVRPVPPAR